jgi:hypothetical protein
MVGRRTLLLGFWRKTAKLEPVADESGKDASFARFRAELLGAVERKDARWLLGVLAEDVKVSFGDEAGRESFARYWELQAPERSRVWGVLRTLMALGGTFDAEGGFTAPYTFTRFPKDWDAYEAVVCVRPRVALLEAGRAGARVIRRLEWEILSLVDGMGEGWYLRVKTGDGMEGWVAAQDVRSPLDYRARFAKLKGRWRMTFLVAGD